MCYLNASKQLIIKITLMATYIAWFLSYLLYCVFEGVRYFTRGVDCDGHVANYVETEQIIVYKQHTASFVQVGEGRGILIKFCLVCKFFCRIKKKIVL